MIRKSNEKLNILFASHTFIGGPFVVGSHHLARELAVKGHNVFHMSTPITLPHLTKIKNNKIYRERFKIARKPQSLYGGNLINYIPISVFPWKIAGPFYLRTGKNLLLSSIFPSLNLKMKQLGCPKEFDILLIDQPYFVGLEEYIKVKKIFYRATDLYSEMTGDSSILTAEKEIIEKADAVIGTSKPVVDYLEKYSKNKPTLLLENGVEAKHFARTTCEPIEYKNIPHPRAVYIGAVDFRFDIEALRTLAQKYSELSLIIIGPIDDDTMSNLKNEKNIYFLGAKSYSVIPDYLAYADVGLLLLNDHKANFGRSPMKLYEYASAGLPVVVKKTEELVRRKEKFLHFYSNKEDLADITRAVLLDGVNKEKIKTFAKEHSWESKARTLIDFIKK